MRDDEFQWEPYGSAMVMKLSGGLDVQGNVASWTHEVWTHPHNNRPARGTGQPARELAPGEAFQGADAGRPADADRGGERNSVPLYDFPNQKVLKHFVPEMPLRTSALRTLGGYANVFALESFIDELALAARADPVEFRLRHLKDPRARAVIEAVAQRALWQARRERGRYARARIRLLQIQESRPATCAGRRRRIDRASGKVRVTAAVRRSTPGRSSTRTASSIRSKAESSSRRAGRSWRRCATTARVLRPGPGDYPIFNFEDVPQVEVGCSIARRALLGVGEGSQAGSRGDRQCDLRRDTACGCAACRLRPSA